MSSPTPWKFVEAHKRAPVPWLSFDYKMQKIFPVYFLYAKYILYK